MNRDSVSFYKTIESNTKNSQKLQLIVLFLINSKSLKENQV